ncbi:hypothetical protein NW755_014541 [Fusarium falciforme]|uniref:Uncharacterized protein n=1 Tax=Fusarium falciforme TaxID=195108 RepID=A0A9W8QTX3_9HYPO|nr:hypothetical protein NW755_014541 [Fusarium falciforme]
MGCFPPGRNKIQTKPNFGIVTSVTAKIYDIEHRDWAIETLVFSGDQVGEVYQAANEHLLINWSYWLNNPDADPNNPIILFWIIPEGVRAVDPAITKPFHDIRPLSIEPVAGDYNDLKDGHVSPRFPLYLQSYNVPAMEKAYKLFTSEIGGDSPFNGSLFMFESYSTQGVRDIDGKSTAFAFRDANLLIAPLITYKPAGPNIDKRAADLGVGLRNILHKASGKEEIYVYMNYAFGDKNAKQWYGSEAWR